MPDSEVNAESWDANGGSAVVIVKTQEPFETLALELAVVMQVQHDERHSHFHL